MSSKQSIALECSTNDSKTTPATVARPLQAPEAEASQEVCIAIVFGDDFETTAPSPKAAPAYTVVPCKKTQTKGEKF